MPTAADDFIRPVMGGSRYYGLDGLRGVAVTMVVAFHLWPHIFPGGWLGVSLFFTLSGFLIVGILDQELAESGSVDLRRFAARRVRRLMPAALLTVAVTLLCAAVIAPESLREVAVDVIAIVTNVHNWHHLLDRQAESVVLDHFWSLAVEEQFYLLAPAAIALKKKPVAVMAASAAVGLVMLFWVAGTLGAYYATPVRGLEIAAGGGLALAAGRRERLRELLFGGRHGKGAMWAVCAASVVVIWAVMGPNFRIGGSVGALNGGPVVMSLIWCVLIAAAIRPGGAQRFLSSAAIRWVGVRSYGIYLFHYPIWAFTENRAVTVMGTLTAAALSWRLIERPIQRTAHGKRAVWSILACAVAAGAAAVITAVAAS